MTLENLNFIFASAVRKKADASNSIMMNQDKVDLYVTNMFGMAVDSRLQIRSSKYQESLAKENCITAMCDENNDKK